MNTVKNTSVVIASQAISKGATKKDRSHRPELVLHDPQELRIVKHKMEQAESVAIVTKPAYTGKKRGRKPKTTNPSVALVVEGALHTPTNAAPAPIKGAISAAKEVSYSITPVKRGPGRPVKATLAPVMEIAIKRGPGRPRKVTIAPIINLGQVPAKRGRKPNELMLNEEPAMTVKLDDYALFYSQKGVADYKVLLTYMQTHSIPVKQAIGLLSGSISIPTEEVLTAFKLGKFRIKNLAHAEHAAKLRNSMRKSAPNIYYKASFTNALARVSAMKGFVDTQLQKNMDKFFMGVEKAETVDGFERQIIDIYNTNLSKKERLVSSHS